MSSAKISYVSRTTASKALVYPVRLDLLSDSGTTLWASTTADSGDLLLAADRNILLFRKPSRLREFVVGGASCSLSQLAGYAQLQEWLRGNPEQRLRALDMARFRDSVRHLHAGRWATWDQTTRTSVLLSLNMLWDMADTAGAEDLKQVLRAHTPLGRLADELTFTPAPEPGDLPALESPETAATFEACVLTAQRFVLRVC